MKHAAITAPKWSSLDDTADMSFEWAEWIKDDSGDVECTFYFERNNVEVDSEDPDAFTSHVDALEVVGAVVADRGVTTYLNRIQLIEMIGYKTITAIDADNLETAIAEAA